MAEPGLAVRTYLDHLSVERGLAANTLTSYRRDLRRYQGFLAERGVDDLDRVDEATVTAFLVRLREGDADHPPHPACCPNAPPGATAGAFDVVCYAPSWPTVGSS